MPRESPTINTPTAENQQDGAAVVALKAAEAAALTTLRSRPKGSKSMILPTTREKTQPEKIPNTKNKADIIPAVPDKQRHMVVD